MLLICSLFHFPRVNQKHFFFYLILFQYTYTSGTSCSLVLYSSDEALFFSRSWDWKPPRLTFISCFHSSRKLNAESDTDSCLELYIGWYWVMRESTVMMSHVWPWAWGVDAWGKMWTHFTQAEPFPTCSLYLCSKKSSSGVLGLRNSPK